MELYSHANFHIHRATHDNDYVEWEEEEEELDYNVIEKSLQEVINSKYDPENYFRKEGTS